jgi:high-affinity Fe2+/Pb2+ permease
VTLKFDQLFALSSRISILREGYEGWIFLLLLLGWKRRLWDMEENTVNMVLVGYRKPVIRGKECAHISLNTLSSP